MTQRLAGLFGSFGKFGSATLAVMGLNIAGAGLVFLSHVVIARITSTTDYGVFVLCVTVITLSLVLVKTGLDAAIVKPIRKALVDDEWEAVWSIYKFVVSRATLQTVVAGIVIVALLYIVARQGDLLLLGGMSVAVAIAVVLSAVNVCTLKGFALPVWSVAPQSIIRPTVTIVICLGVMLLFDRGFSAVGALIAFGGGFLVSAVIAAIRVMREFRSHRPFRHVSPPASEIRELGLTLLVVTAATLIMRQCDILMVGALTDAATAGVYSAAVRIADVAGFPLIAINTVIAPLIATWYAKQDKRVLQSRATGAAQISTLTTCALIVVIVLSSHWVLALFGEGFVVARTSLFFLLAGQLALAICGCAQDLLIMTGFHRIAARQLWMCVLINVVLNAIFVTQFGMHGAAIATFVSMLIWSMLLARAARQLVKVDSTVFAPLRAI